MKNIQNAWEIMLKHGYGQTFGELQLVSCADGKCIAEMDIKKEHANIANTLHGGLIATLIDHVTSFAIVSLQYPHLEPSFSINMNISYLNKSKVGDRIVIEGDCEKHGVNISFARAKIYDKISKNIIATGDHVKFIPKSSASNSK
ncbi:unnamed protein product [Gordionus sp. m RMFG-2023]